MKLQQMWSGRWILFGLLFADLTVRAIAQTSTANEWTWEGGDSTVGANYGYLSVYGTLGVPSASNLPGSRFSSAAWTDKSGNFWLFGGEGYYSLNESWGYFNDLWKYNPATNEWTWYGGGSPEPTTGYGQPGVYGKRGSFASGNIPGGRVMPMAWTDPEGNFWLFGGLGSDANGSDGWLNDLWEYDVVNGEWAWMGGDNTVGNGGPGSNGPGQPGVYGDLGTPAVGNTPGARASGATWVDGDGNLWLFAGDGYDSRDNEGTLNDLWEFNRSVNEWTWMGGSSTIPVSGNEPGIYGTLGMPAAGNIPGGRSVGMSWTDSNGNFWLFGGDGFDSNGYLGHLNDLWEFNPATQMWVWMGGSNSFPASCATIASCGFPGVYGTLGTPSAANAPGSRSLAAVWMDNSGHAWLFGGSGFDADGTLGGLNDVWQLNLSNLQWMWMQGANVLPWNNYGFYDEPGVYGAEGTAAPGNTPGSRSAEMTWSEQGGNFWLFAGSGFDANNIGDGLNDLWKYNPPEPDFTISATPTSATIAAGQSATTTLSISPLYGFSSAVAFSCSGLPSGAACSFSPSTVTPSGTATTTTVTISTASTTASVEGTMRQGFAGSLLAATLCLVIRKRKSLLNCVVVLGICLAFACVAIGCGSSSGGQTSPPPVQPVTSTITITAASGSVQKSTAFTLTVN